MHIWYEPTIFSLHLNFTISLRRKFAAF